MGEKLTKAQVEALEGGPLRYSTLTGHCWRASPEGYTIKVRVGTFNSLSLRGLVKFDGGASTNTTSVYTITDKGRAALAESAS